MTPLNLPCWPLTGGGIGAGLARVSSTTNPRMASSGTSPRRPPRFNSHFYPPSSSVGDYASVTFALALLGPIGWYIIGREGYRKYCWNREENIWIKHERERPAHLAREARAMTLLYEQFP